MDQIPSKATFIIKRFITDDPFVQKIIETGMRVV